MQTHLENHKFFCAQRIEVFSSDELINWRDPHEIKEIQLGARLWQRHIYDEDCEVDCSPQEENIGVLTENKWDSEEA